MSVFAMLPDNLYPSIDDLHWSVLLLSDSLERKDVRELTLANQRTFLPRRSPVSAEKRFHLPQDQSMRCRGRAVAIVSIAVGGCGRTTDLASQMKHLPR